MDHFGIGRGVLGAVNIYLQSSRRTGRTASLVESLKDGDRVVFLTEREGRRVQAMCKDRGVAIEVIVNDPKYPERLFGSPSPLGDERTVFDHSWVEQYYLNAIDRAQSEIDRFQSELSGQSEPHRETRRRAQEIARWRA